MDGEKIGKCAVMATHGRRLAEVLAHGDKLRRRGEDINFEELCHDCPELIQEVRERLRAAPITGRTADTAESIQICDPQPDDENLNPGKQLIPGYTLVQRLGRGGYGEVWKASAPGGFLIALKFVPLDAETLHIEERSLDIIKTLRHPNLLTTFGSWRTDNYLVIAMELADGTLRDRYHEAVAERCSGIPRDELLQYFLEAARGIDFLNSQQVQLDGSERPGVQHRDIKPENILIVGNGVKVADFGLARLLLGAQTGHTGHLTHLNAAPEFFRGTTSQQSDQYSLAITYCQLRGGTAPFSGSPAEIMYGHLTQTPNLEMLPPEERTVVARALSKTPTDRWPSCCAFVDALCKCLPSNSNNTTPQLIPRRPTAAQPFSRRLIAFTGLFVAAIAPAVCIGLFVEYGGFQRTSRTHSEVSAPTVNSDTTDVSTHPKYEPEIVSTSTDMKLLLIPAGSIMIGSPESEAERHSDEGPQHAVTISHLFYLGALEVTQEQYAKVMGTNPSYFSKSGSGSANTMRGQETRRFPVEEVSWFDAIEFCNQLSELDGREPCYKLTNVERIDGAIRSAEVTRVPSSGYRLPTEAEWEFACRANTTTPYSFGALLNGDESNVDGNYPYGTTTKGPFLARTSTVGSYWKNSFGLCDMHGNVMEWCWDLYDEKGGRVTDLKPSDAVAELASGTISAVIHGSSHRVLRGGSWADNAASARSARRIGMSPASRYYTIGFRIAADATNHGR